MLDAEFCEQTFGAQNCSLIASYADCVRKTEGTMNHENACATCDKMFNGRNPNQRAVHQMEAMIYQKAMSNAPVMFEAPVHAIRIAVKNAYSLPKGTSEDVIRKAGKDANKTVEDIMNLFAKDSDFGTECMKLYTSLQGTLTPEVDADYVCKIASLIRKNHVDDILMETVKHYLSGTQLCLEKHKNLQECMGAVIDQPVTNVHEIVYNLSNNVAPSTVFGINLDLLLSVVGLPSVEPQRSAGKVNVKSLLNKIRV